MERDKFDKKLADRMHFHKMQPDDVIWSRIEATLDIAPIHAPIQNRGKIFKLAATITSVAAALLLSFLLLNNREKPIEEIVTLPEIKKFTEERIAEHNPTKKEVSTLALAIQHTPHRAAKKVTERTSIVTYHEPTDSIVETKVPKQETENEPQKTQKTRTTNVAQNYYSQPYKQSSVRKTSNNNKGKLAISVSGSGNFSSTTTTVGNNSLIRPLRAINQNNVIGLYTSKNDNRKWKHNMPLSFSITVQKMITNKIGLETGLTYTYLSSTSKGESILDQDIKQQLNYLGIPLSVVYSIAKCKKFELYAKGGFLVDKAISAKGTSKIDDLSQSIDISTKGVQFSALLQVGASYNLTNYMSLYLEPTGNYYFKSNQPISYRTENDFGFTAMVGLRFKL